MPQHSCLLCIGSNSERHIHMTDACQALIRHFPDIRFGEEMETEAIGDNFLFPFSNQVAIFHTSLSAEEVRTILKGIERQNGRAPEDKTKGIVKLDIDLLIYDDFILKPADLKKDFVLKGMKQLNLL